MFSLKKVFEETFLRNCILCVPKSNLLYFVARSRLVDVIELKTKKLINTIDMESHVQDLQITSCANFLLAACSDGNAKVVNLNTEKVVTFQGHSRCVYCIIECGDKDVLTGSGDTNICRWDRFTGKLICTYVGHIGFIHFIVFDVKTNIIFSGSGYQEIFLWNAETGDKIGELKGHKKWITSLLLLNDTTIVSGSGDKTLKIWDIPSRKEIMSIHCHESPVNSLVLSPDGQFLLSGSWDETIRVWSVATGQCANKISCNDKWLTQVKVTADGRYLFVGYPHGYEINEITPAFAPVIHQSMVEVNGNRCTMKLLTNGTMVDEKGDEIEIKKK